MKRTLMRLLAPVLALVIGVATIATAADNYGERTLNTTGTDTQVTKKRSIDTGSSVYADGVVIVDSSGVAAGTTANPLISTLSTSAYSASATFTPAASSHVANDANGAAGTFASMGPSAGRIIITSATLEIDGTAAEATAWRLYLYNVTPPSAYADDAAWDIASGDRASYLGYVDLGTAVDLGSTQWVETSGINKQLKLAGTSVFAYLVNLTTLTPAAVGHIVTLHAIAPRRRHLPPRTGGRQRAHTRRRRAPNVLQAIGA